MASSGEGDRALAGSGEGDRAVAGSGEGDRAVAGSGESQRAVAGSGKDERALLVRSLEYPCTARLRFRRLLAYLHRYSYADVYQTLRDRTPGVVFHARDLVSKVKAGQLREAYYYVLDFVPALNRASPEGKLLALFLRDIMAINYFADGQTGVAILLCDWFVKIFRHPMLDKYPCFATMVAHVLFLRPELARASLDWQLVRNKAAKMAADLVYKTPELKDSLDFPRGPKDLCNVVPVGSRFRGTRHMKKNLGRKQSTDLAQFYLQLKKRLPSLSQGGCHGYSGAARNGGEKLIALLENALQAGRRSIPKQGNSAVYSSSEVFPLQTMLKHGTAVLPNIQGKQECLSKQGMTQTHAVCWG